MKDFKNGSTLELVIQSWYWLADALFWQLSIDHSIDVQYQVAGSHVTTSHKNTWDTVPYFGLTDLLMILDLWSTLLSLSKLPAVQDHAQNLEDQLWIEGRREWVLYLTNVWVAAISIRKVSFSWECLNINFLQLVVTWKCDISHWLLCDVDRLMGIRLRDYQFFLDG